MIPVRLQRIWMEIVGGEWGPIARSINLGET